MQSLTMWYGVWGSPHWHGLSPNPHFTIESPDFPIPVCNLVVPRLSKAGHVLGVCLTSLGCVVAVYVVLVLVGGHSLIVIPETGRGLQDLSLFGGFAVQDVV